MVIQPENNSSYTAQDERLDTLLQTKEAGQPILALRIGSQQDPGIRRKYRPDEDTLFVMQGVMSSTAPDPLPTPFVLLVVADGMGGQGHGRTASRLAGWSLVKYMSRSLMSQYSHNRV